VKSHLRLSAHLIGNYTQDAAGFFICLAGSSAFQIVRAFGKSKHFVMQQNA
jgi:hypothetical protein